MESTTLDVDVAAEKFEKVKDLKGGPVPREEIITNLRASKELGLPVFSKQPKRDGSFIFVAGGPSLANFLDELRARKAKGEFICTSNNTHDYLVDNGIIPDACCIIDPKEIVATYVKKPQAGVKYYVGTVCNKKVGTALKEAGMDVTLVCTGYGLEDESDIKLQSELYPETRGYSYLVGGTMMGLRAMPMAMLLGFAKIEYYGFDSCFAANPPMVKEGEPEYEAIKKACDGRSYTDPETKQNYVLSEAGGIFYAYGKKRGEDIQVAQTSDGKRYLTSPCLAHQVKQLIKWADRYEGRLEIIIHGDSLSQHMLALHKIELEKARIAVGDKRWTKSYEKLQKDLHAAGEYGRHGDVDLELLGRAILSLAYQVNRPITILDYGCGSGALGKAVNKLFNPEFVKVHYYDPFIEEFSKEPEGQFDIVACFDMLEHVETPCVHNVLKHLASYARFVAVMTIHTSDAVKTLADGRNAHLTQRSPNWWLEMLGKHLALGEAQHSDHHVIVVTQSLDAKEKMEKETNIVEPAEDKLIANG